MNTNHPGGHGLARERLQAEWRTLIDETPAEVLTCLRALLHNHRDDLRTLYNNYLVEDGEIAAILGDAANRDAFTLSFLEGVGHLLDPQTDCGETFYTQQQEIGALMARIGLPPYALSRAMRKLSLWLLAYVGADNTPAPIATRTVHFIISIIGLALEIREISYQSGITSHMRVEEGYRLFALGQNLAMERERQRALLLEWSHQLLRTFHQNAGTSHLPRLWQSEFGLWLNHKGRILFDDMPRMAITIAALDRIDEALVPALERVDFDDRAAVGAVIQQIEDQIAIVRFSLNDIFDLHLEIERGRDPLTQLLNRRFMPSLLMREIELQKTLRDNGFCLLLVDIDHFKAINDVHGHRTGDLALQYVAQAVTSSVRASDFTFRYGGEEIVVLLVDCDDAAALQTAERIRTDIAALRVPLPEGGDMTLTASIGVAAFAGEFDYEALMARADRAMYLAKSRGRNQVAVA